jgi:hypothetical protein
VEEKDLKTLFFISFPPKKRASVGDQGTDVTTVKEMAMTRTLGITTMVLVVCG